MTRFTPAFVIFALTTYLGVSSYGLPPGFRTHSVPRQEGLTKSVAQAGSEAVGSALEELVGRIAGYRQWRAGSVTDVDRAGFRVDIGLKDGVERGLQAEVLRADEDGDLVVARAKVVDAGEDNSRLRRTDRVRRLRIRVGDRVRIVDSRISVLVGGVGGEYRALSEALRTRLLSLLRSREDITVLEGPDLKSTGSGARDQAFALCESALDQGCSHAIAGWNTIRGDSLHLVLELIDASTRRTVELYAASVEIDPAIKAMLRELLTIGRDEGTTEPPPYDTGLYLAFETVFPATVLAAHVLGDYRSLVLIFDKSLAIYNIDGEGGRLLEIGGCDIESPPRRVPCRDPVATTARLDSDGDGSDELVIWSSRLAGPAAFSLERRDGRILLERAETYWLPWAAPLGDALYASGTSVMTSPSSSRGLNFFEWAELDADRDGLVKIFLTHPGAVMTVRDSSMNAISTLAATGSALAIEDMNLDGSDEIIGTTPVDLDEPDHLVFYNWTGADLEEVWRSGSLQGGVTSLSAGLLDADEFPDLAAVIRTGRRSTESRVLLFLTSRD